MDQDDQISDAASILTTLTSSSLSTTATAPNLPGPGRNLGLLLGRLGGGLERFVNKRAERFGTTTRADTSHGLQLVRVESRVSADTNATAPNLPGAGRTVGNLLSTLGKGLERLMTRRSLQIGLGPDAVARDIRAIYEGSTVVRTDKQTQGPPGPIPLALPGSYLWEPSEAESKALMKLCKMLMKYSK